MTHTPKPWHVDSTHVRHAVNSGDVHIAMVNIGPGLTEEEALANAYLIAAAPDMFETLCVLGVTPYDYYCFCPPERGVALSGDHTGECREAQETIAKARGELSEHDEQILKEMKENTYTEGRE